MRTRRQAFDTLSSISTMSSESHFQHIGICSHAKTTDAVKVFICDSTRESPSWSIVWSWNKSEGGGGLVIIPNKSCCIFSDISAKSRWMECKTERSSWMFFCIPPSSLCCFLCFAFPSHCRLDPIPCFKTWEVLWNCPLCFLLSSSAFWEQI